MVAVTAAQHTFSFEAMPPVTSCAAVSVSGFTFIYMKLRGSCHVMSCPTASHHREVPRAVSVPYIRQVSSYRCIDHVDNYVRYQRGTRQVGRLVEHSCDVCKEDDSQVIICSAVSVEAGAEPRDDCISTQDRAVLRRVQHHVSMQDRHQSHLQHVPDRIKNAWMRYT